MIVRRKSPSFAANQETTRDRRLTGVGIVKISLSRWIAMIVLGMLAGSYIHHDYERWSQRGREAFMAYQTQRFEHYMAVPRPLSVTMIGATFFTITVIAVYELIARLVSKLLDAGEPDLGGNQGQPSTQGTVGPNQPPANV
jgi:hypothetical protein